MLKKLHFNITCSQKLDDGDTALVEEYRNVDVYDMRDIIDHYERRAIDKSFVVSFSINVEIKR